MCVYVCVCVYLYIYSYKCTHIYAYFHIFEYMHTYISKPSGVARAKKVDHETNVTFFIRTCQLIIIYSRTENFCNICLLFLRLIKPMIYNLPGNSTVFLNQPRKTKFLHAKLANHAL